MSHRYNNGVTPRPPYPFSRRVLFLVTITPQDKNIYQVSYQSLNTETQTRTFWMTRGQIAEKIRLGVFKPTDDAQLASLLLSL